MLWAPIAPGRPAHHLAHEYRHRTVAGQPDPGWRLGDERQPYPRVPPKTPSNSGRPDGRRWPPVRRSTCWSPSPAQARTRGLAWITLAEDDQAWTELGTSAAGGHRR